MCMVAVSPSRRQSARGTRAPSGAASPTSRLTLRAPGADEPPLEIADRVLAGPARLLCHVLSPLPASARSLSPFSAVSMMVRSALRFSIPGIGIRTSTARS